MSDSGANPLRSMLDIPIVAPGRASYLTALMLGNSFSVLTQWDGWIPVYAKGVTEARQRNVPLSFGFEIAYRRESVHQRGANSRRRAYCAVRNALLEELLVVICARGPTARIRSPSTITATSFWTTSLRPSIMCAAWIT